ncbi:hypothetical protein BJ912DRAFT_925603 [Pholiota molesta]|nr:hypothetical protein BJ912DRAFT_925603 [Pholiota molesta]
MGIFDVSISTAYGEGAGRAFFRLVEEIFRSKKDVSDIFNWAGDRNQFSWQPTTSFFLPIHLTTNISHKAICPKDSPDYQLLDKKQYLTKMDITFGTLNVEEGATSIHIPKTCSDSE